MNVVDLELGRNFYVSRRLMLKPFYGLKGAWNKQHMNVNFTEATAAFNNSMTNKIKNWGIGCSVGMDTSWHFSRSFSLIGDVAFTGLWKSLKSHVLMPRNAPSGAVSGSNVDVKENQYVVEPVVKWDCWD